MGLHFFTVLSVALLSFWSPGQIIIMGAPNRNSEPQRSHNNLLNSFLFGPKIKKKKKNLGAGNQTLEVCPLLGNYAAYSGYSLPKFRDNISVPPPGVNKSSLQGQDFLTLEDGTEMLFRNVGNELPLYAAQYPTREQISPTPQRKPEIQVLKFLTLPNGSDRLSRNVFKELPLYAA